MKTKKQLTLVCEEVEVKLVVESKNGLIANVAPLKALIKEVEAEKEKALKEVGVKAIDELSSKLTKFIGKFQRYRIEQLSSITSIPKEFISLENVLKGLSKDLVAISSERTAEEREREYKKADENMQNVLLKLVSAHEYGEKVDLRLFDAELMKMRTKAYAQPYETGKPKKKVVEKITDLWNSEYSPIKEKEELEKIKEVEAIQFEQAQRPIDGSYEELRSVLSYYKDLLIKLPTLYPNSHKEFKRNVDAKVKVVRSMLEAKKANAEAEAEAKAKATIDKNVKSSLDSLKSIEYKTKEDCEKAIFRARKLYKDANSKELMSEIHEFANFIKQTIVDIEMAEKEARDKQRLEEERYRREKREEDERLEAEANARREEEERLEAEANAREERLEAEAKAREEQMIAEANVREERKATLLISFSDLERVKTLLDSNSIEYIVEI